MIFVQLSRLKKALALKRGGAAYAVGRLVAVCAQVLLAAVASRVLDTPDLGRLATALVVGSVPGVILGMSLRRLAVQSPPGADLTDLKVTALCGGFIGVAVTGLIGTAILDEKTGIITAEIAAWRAADGYSEIALGTWTRDGRLRRAGLSIGLRNTTSVVTTVVLMEPVGVVGALAAGLIVRLGVAIADTHQAHPEPWHRIKRRVLGRTMSLAMQISGVAVAVVSVEAAATIGVSVFGGLDEASLLTPLGRIRMGLMLAAATIIEIYYADIVIAVRSGARLDVVTRGPIFQFLVLSAFVTAILVFGLAAALFGPRLDDENLLVLLACLSGISMGLAITVSSIAMAQGRMRAQVLAFGAATVVATSTVAVGGWSLEAFFAGQIAAPILTILMLVSRRWIADAERAENKLERWAHSKI